MPSSPFAGPSTGIDGVMLKGYRYFGILAGEDAGQCRRVNPL